MLDGTRSEPLAGKKIKWIDVDLAAKLDAQGYPFQGYESIAFVGDAVIIGVGELPDLRRRGDVERAGVAAGEVARGRQDECVRAIAAIGQGSVPTPE